MKRFAFIAIILCLPFLSQAAEILWPNASNMAFTNTVFSLSITNASTTNVFGTLKSQTHTFDNFYTATGTNVCTNSIDVTTDPSLTQWINVTSIVFTASGSFEYQSVGKHTGFRFRTTMLGTNANNLNSLFYMGQ
jgi:hypothetical protein